MMDYNRYGRGRAHYPADDSDMYDPDAAYYARLRALGYGSDYDEYDEEQPRLTDRLLGFGRAASALPGVRVGGFVANGLVAVIAIVVVLVVASVTITGFTADKPRGLNLGGQASSGGAVLNAGNANSNATQAVASADKPGSDDARPKGAPVNMDGWTITKNYAEHFGPGPYGAIDVAFDPRTSWGAPIIATHSGTVHVSTDSLYGNKIQVKNDHYMTQYGHLQNFKATEGQVVRRGDVIGFMGSTGNSSGPHVDYQVWQDGKNMNPMGFLK